MLILGSHAGAAIVCGSEQKKSPHIRRNGHQLFLCPFLDLIRQRSGGTRVMIVLCLLSCMELLWVKANKKPHTRDALGPANQNERTHPLSLT